MSVHITRCAIGDLARLQCDLCPRRSEIYLSGKAPSMFVATIELVRSELRAYCRDVGWGSLPGRPDEPMILDVCPDCCIKIRGHLENERSAGHGQAQSGPVDQA